MEWATMQAMTRLGTVLFFGGAAVAAMTVAGVHQIHPAVPAGLAVAGLAAAALGATLHILRTQSVQRVSAEVFQNVPINEDSIHATRAHRPP